MKKTWFAGAVVALALGAAGLADDTKPAAMPQPQQEHQSLKQLEGQWSVTGECWDPSGKSTSIAGVESASMLGGFWTVARYEGQVQGKPFSGLLSLGFDAQKKKYVSTWIDSVSSHLWHSEGSANSSGRLITLEGQGPDVMQPTQLVKTKLIIELVDQDHRTFTMQREKGGKWNTTLRLNYTRSAPLQTPQLPQ